MPFLSLDTMVHHNYDANGPIYIQGSCSVVIKKGVSWIHEYMIELSHGLFENNVGIEADVFEYC
jgi:hypothetical protein